MKNLYNKKGKIHPSPSVPDHLSLLPATIITLAAALSEEDKQVLAYLISCCGTTTNTNSSSLTAHQKKSADDGKDHDPMFNCNCFSCYMSYWVRWDTSPNRELIHDIIEAYEEGLFKKKRKSLKKKKDKSNKRDLKEKSTSEMGFEDSRELDSVEKNSGDGSGSGSGDVEAELEKGTVRKITSFLGDKIWGIWSRD
ncbi:conserved hypothetical protein [Ricinus communis]|uniref:Uncharacterized protein n=1 Tax=Ricinus communis TaxID=3988 RepID=B9SSJ1_RICCO|nr:conserved hypothetical protein [Ricinus communis]|eukprot:XP_002528960.1 uncharacterized protein LOC8265589 [Ricinus communis]